MHYFFLFSNASATFVCAAFSLFFYLDIMDFSTAMFLTSTNLE